MHIIQDIITSFVEKNKRKLYVFLSFLEGNIWELILKLKNVKVIPQNEVYYEDRI